MLAPYASHGVRRTRLRICAWGNWRIDLPALVDVGSSSIGITSSSLSRLRIPQRSNLAGRTLRRARRLYIGVAPGSEYSPEIGTLIIQKGVKYSNADMRSRVYYINW